MELNIAWKYFYYVHLFKFAEKQAQSINDVAFFFEIIDPSLPLVTHFTKQAYGVTSPFGRSPLPPKWVMSFIDGPLVNILKLYLSPEFCLDSKILRPCPIFSNSMASSDWWMMTDLFSNISKTFIFSDTFISFT